MVSLRTERLILRRWRSGYATEAALECLRLPFEELRLDEVVSSTVPQNEPSRRVMRRIGMSHDETDDFDHPRFPDDRRLRRHELYRIDQDPYEERDAAPEHPETVAALLEKMKAFRETQKRDITEVGVRPPERWKKPASYLIPR